MLGQYIDQILQWPVIIQGAIGSFLFWIFLQIIRYILGLIQKVSGRVSSSFQREKRIREYIYRKYTSQPGLAFYPQGFFVTFDRVLFNIISGLIFLCISFLFLGISPISTSIAIIGALIYFFKGLIWLIPSREWEHIGNTIENWELVKGIENDLWGKFYNDTEDQIQKLKNEELK